MSETLTGWVDFYDRTKPVDFWDENYIPWPANDKENTPMTDFEQIEAAAKQFPETFGLKAFPGDVFTISQAASYVTGDGTVMLYTVRKDGDRWEAFAKGTIPELKSQIA